MFLLLSSLLDDTAAGEEEMLMKGNVAMEAETLIPMDLLAGVVFVKKIMRNRAWPEVLPFFIWWHKSCNGRGNH